MHQNDLPILYSFRRCPYAMRARMAIVKSGKTCILREIALRNKPDELIAVSPKATVPVLVLKEGLVLEESLKIMQWALSDNDPESWLKPEFGSFSEMLDLVEEIDGDFKYHLDRYKYSNRYQNADPTFHQNKALDALRPINQRLKRGGNIFGERISLADIAIFPFVRQFANTDRVWFDRLDFKLLQDWLERHLVSELFAGVMKKSSFWRVGEEEPLFP